LQEENIKVKFEYNIDYLDEFALLIEEGLIVELAQHLFVLLWTLLDEIFKLLLLKDIPQQCMEIDEVISPSGVYVGLVKHFSTFIRHCSEGSSPPFFELLLIDKPLSIFMDANIDIERRGISAKSNFLLHLPHLPLEFVASLLQLEVKMNQIVEDLTDCCQLSPHRLRVELKGVVHDAAIVERQHMQVAWS
jgi:hypothetical protein